jgi:hypothetical protein
MSTHRHASGIFQLQGAFAKLGGLESLKSFCLRAMQCQGHRNPLTRPRGVLLLEVPSGGKSAFAKALGTETGRQTLILDIGALMGSQVGMDFHRGSGFTKRPLSIRLTLIRHL